MSRGTKQKILVADDSKLNRIVLTDMIGKEYDTIEAANGVEAVEALKKYGKQIDLVLLDIVMPHMDGFEVLNIMNKNHWIDDIPVIMISAEKDPDSIEHAYQLGAMDFINRPFDALIVRRRIINTIMLYAKQKKLTSLVADQISEKEKSSSLMIDILSHIVESRNGESGLHVIHVRTITKLILNTLVRKTDKYPMSHSDISLISTASALHDIGKIVIPEEVLNKSGRLTDEEYAIMKTHSMMGASMLSELPFYEDEKLIRMAYEICRWHHERYDGKGYPDGLVGDEIPIAPQIVALADVYDALTSERVYKKAYPHEKAVEMILDGQCGIFNPILMECLLETGDRIKEELGKAATVGQSSLQETREIVEELVADEEEEEGELPATQESLNLLEHERTKYQFLASMAKDILFEYTTMPPMVAFSGQEAEHLGLNGTVLDPCHDKLLLQFFGEENMRGLEQAVKQATPEQPLVWYECDVELGEETQKVQIVCCSIWLGDEPVHRSSVIGSVSLLQDGQETQRDLRGMVARDSLSGLLNLTYAKLEIKKEIEKSKDSEFALALFELDRSKTANGLYGHISGDNVLRYLADRIRCSVRSRDLAARVCGDEFLILIEYRTEREVSKAVDRIFNALSGEYDSFPIALSMGVARTDNVGRDCEALLKSADQALCAVKWEKKGGYGFYDSSMQGMRSVLSSMKEIGN